METSDFRPNDPISRQEAAVVLTKAFKLEASNKDAVDKFADAASVASWSRYAVSALVERGYVSGRPGNKFAPKDNITRAEAVKLLDNIANELVYVAGTYSEDIKGNLVVNTADVVLKDMVIEGDLYLAQGIGDGDATLDGVTVKGRTIVLGGGENSIIINNSSLQGTLVVIKQNGAVRIVAKGASEVTSVEVKSGAILQTEDLTGKGFGEIEIIEVPEGESIVLDGDFEKVIIAAAEASVEITGGTVADLEIASDAAGAVVNIAEAASVTTLTANAAVEVKGTGKIETANIKAEDVVIEQKPGKVNVDEGITAEVGGETIEGGKTPSTPSTGGTTTQSVSATAISLIKAGGAEIPGTINGDTATFDLSDKNAYPDGLMITGMKIVCYPENCSLTIKSIVSANDWNSHEERNITNLSNITVSKLINSPIFGDDISLGSLRILFGNSVTVTGTLNCPGYISKDVSVTITLGTRPTELNTQLLTIKIMENPKEAKASIASAELITKPVAGHGISSLLLSFLGNDDMPKKIKVNNGEWIDVTTSQGKVDAANAIAAAAGCSSWQELTFQNLIGLTIYVTKDDDTSDPYILHIVNDINE